MASVVSPRLAHLKFGIALHRGFVHNERVDGFEFPKPAPAAEMEAIAQVTRGWAAPDRVPPALLWASAGVPCPRPPRILHPPTCTPLQWEKEREPLDEAAVREMLGLPEATPAPQVGGVLCPGHALRC